jgi:4-hydroxy-3-methylbut-2-enyl diphosphate reductase
MAEALGERPLVVVRAIAGEPNGDPHSGGARAMGSLLAARPNLERWAGAVRARTVLLATPRSFCAGVDRAIAIVERALERFGAPVYVRRQIVHNIHVVRDLEGKGAVFVEELDEVPPNGTVVLAAHGVSPAVREEAAGRGDLTVVDATCPLVAKVHKEATRFAAQDYSIVLIGHADHEEVAGTMGEAPDRIRLVENIEGVEALDLEADEKVAYLTQTTLATDETAGIVEALRGRFSHLVGPPAEDICYATQNRQDAVRALAGRCDLLLVAGSSNSSNSNRLVEVARREGCRAHLVEDEGSIHLSWLESTGTVGITAGASAPESLVVCAIEMLSLLGPIDIAEVVTVQETVSFALPNQVR